ncbi:MAG: hypothetical protein RLZ35_920 [Pseudomonadota bacterium]|jgi:cysteinyl-tRNA synthetase
MHTKTPEIVLYNSLIKEKAPLKPIHSGQVTLYVCGVTVYDHCHIGHARVLLVFDVLRRFLKQQGLAVTYIRNITDVDDKIIKRAIETKQTEQSLDDAVKALTGFFIKEMTADCQALNILPPTFEPKATEYIPNMLDLITQLMNKKAAYQGKNGDIYFDVHAFPEYGHLSHRQLSDLQAGARVDVDAFKNNPLDFVLWKHAKPEDEIYWDSPWGRGRPGWHIECSAMSLDCLKHEQLGHTLDIHGGGHDLKFPHHENERAQSEVATGVCFANVWMHVGFVQINQEKMSKSLGNFLIIKDCLKDYHPEVLRYFMLSSHYRSPVEYSDQSMESAFVALNRLYRALSVSKMTYDDTELPPTFYIACQRYQEKFDLAMADDINTPVALSILFDIAKEINRLMNSEISVQETLFGTLKWTTQAPSIEEIRYHAAIKLTHLMKALGSVLGLLQCDPTDFNQDARNTRIGRPMDMPELGLQEIEKLKLKRELARKNKDFKEADRIRDYLQKHGVVLSDKKVEHTPKEPPLQNTP